MVDNLQDKMNPDVLSKIVKKIITEFEKENSSEDALNNV